MTQQLSTINTSSSDASEFSTGLFVEVCRAHGLSFRAASTSSTGTSGTTSSGSGTSSSVSSQAVEIQAFYGDGLTLMPNARIDAWGTTTSSEAVDTSDGKHYLHIVLDKTSGNNGIKLNPDGTGASSDLSRFTNGSLVLVLRSFSNATLNIQLEPDYPGWTDLTPYGLTNDGQWHTVIIPVKQIAGYASEIQRLLGIHFDGSGSTGL